VAHLTPLRPLPAGRTWIRQGDRKRAIITCHGSCAIHAISMRTQGTHHGRFLGVGWLDHVPELNPVVGLGVGDS
jgi:hypothetical protein